MRISLKCSHCNHAFTLPAAPRLTRCPACDEMTRGDIPAAMSPALIPDHEARLDRERAAHYRATEAWDRGDTMRAMQLENQAAHQEVWAS